MNIKIIRALLVMALAAGVLTFSVVAAEKKAKRAETQAFMRQKLVCAQAVLEGLTLEKFDVVSKNSIRMRDMTHNNLWFMLKNPDYMTLTTNYQKSVEGLYMAALDKNLEAATEAYTKVSRYCVESRRVMRLEQRKADSSGAGTKTKP